MSTGAPCLRWNQVSEYDGPMPQPRHGHRAVAIKGLIVVFGGGNDGIFSNLHVFNTATQQWFVPAIRGDVPSGCASHGMVCDGTKIIVYGGMHEFGKYSNDLYELQASRWEWKRLKWRTQHYENVPCSRIGHSFTYHESKVYMFGGLANSTDDPKNNEPLYLNDLHVLELRPQFFSASALWVKPKVTGVPPSPRESHSANLYTQSDTNSSFLIIFGGMNGGRLGDLHMLKLGSELSWVQPELTGAAPAARSLHTASLISDRLFIFGGWTSASKDIHITDSQQWSVTNDTACLNLKTNCWEKVVLDERDGCPSARAGHCGVTVNSRVYIWSGRDGYNKLNGRQVCCGDMWYLETAKPDPPSRIQLVRAQPTSLMVCWGSVPTAEAYLVQIQKYDIPPIETTAKQPYLSAGPPQKTIKLTSQANIPSQLSPSIIRLPSINTNDGTIMSPSDSQTIGGSVNVLQGVSQSKASSNSPKVLALVRQIGKHNVSLTPATQTPTEISSSSGTTLIALAPNTSSTSKLSSSPQMLQIISPAHMKPTTTPSRAASNLIKRQPTILKVHTDTSGRQAVLIAPKTGAQLPKNIATPSTTVESAIAEQISTGGEQAKDVMTGLEIAAASPGLPAASPGLPATSPGASTEAPIKEEMETDEGRPEFFATTVNAVTRASNLSASLKNVASAPSANAMATETDAVLPDVIPDTGNSTTKPTQENLPMDTLTTENVTSMDVTSTTTVVKSAVIKTLTNEESNTNKDVSSSNDAKYKIIVANQKISTAKKHAWQDVAVVKGTSAVVTHYHVPSKESDSTPTLANLVPGYSYKLRVAGINTCGRGRWSEVSAFKTPLPNLPSPPTCVKILKLEDGAHISWEEPANMNGAIYEYSVYMAVNTSSTTNSQDSPRKRKDQISFGRVFVGITTMCLVTYSMLATGYVDPEKPALIFRLAAKNVNGYGPALQVHWLQDPKSLTPKLS